MEILQTQSQNEHHTWKALFGQASAASDRVSAVYTSAPCSLISLPSKVHFGHWAELRDVEGVTVFPKPLQTHCCGVWQTFLAKCWTVSRGALSLTVSPAVTQWRCSVARVTRPQCGQTWLWAAVCNLVDVGLGRPTLPPPCGQCQLAEDTGLLSFVCSVTVVDGD